MYAISDLFTEYLQSRSRDWLVKVSINGTEYGSSAIVDFVIENNLTSEQEFQLGTAIISKCTLRLKTSSVIASNAKVVPSVALQLPASLDGANIAWQDAMDTWATADYPWNGAVTEWLPLGEFYVDRREQVNDVWVFTCYDKLVQANVPYISALTYPTTMKAVLDEICTSLGFTYDSSVVIDPAYQIQAGPAGFTKLQVLGYIASANAACVYVAKDGTLRFRRFSAADEPVTDLTSSEYIRAKQTNPVKTFTRVVVTYDKEDELTYTAGSGDENHTLYVENPFMTQQMTNDLQAKTNGFSYTPIDMPARGYPQIEVGDRFRFGKAAVSPAWQLADVAWQDADYTWDGYEYGGGISLALNQTFVFRGGLKMTIDAPSKSEQQSEFEVDGTISGQIKKLNKDAVRVGKAYYGATITRENGLIVEREDHKSKLTLNSDVMDWQVDGVSSLHYDSLANRLKFTGTLEGVDGEFTGTIKTNQLIAGSALITGNLIADGTITAAEIAAGAVISDKIAAGAITADKMTVAALSAISADLGTITAGSITGINITGSVITGGTIQNQTDAANKVYSDATGFHANDVAGVERITIGTTPAQGAKAIITRDSLGVAQGVYTYDTETVDGAIRTGQYITSHGSYLLFSDDGDVRLQNAAGQGFRAVSGTPEINDGFGWVGIADASDISNLQSQISGKAISGASTSSYTQSDHNHGIPHGAQLMGADGVTVYTFVSSGGFTHSHTQN